MSVTRISYFEARTGMADKLHAFLLSLMPAIKGSSGCGSLQLLRNQQNPHTFVVIETWTSVEAHRASLKNIPQELLDEAMLLLASPPSGTYYS